MKEIKRSQYLRGTKAWKARNWFVFGGLAFTLIIGAAPIYFFQGVTETLQKQAEEDKRRKAERRQRVYEIQERQLLIKKMRIEGETPSKGLDQ